MPNVRELMAGETALAYPAMSELRPNIDSVAEFVARVDDVQRAEGYRLVASFDDEAVAVAGFRVGNNLAWGRYLYVDDLVTCESHQGRGHGAALMEWLANEAKQLGCDQLHLDSGTHRHGAHRFYLNQRLPITSFHFGAPMDSL